MARCSGTKRNGEQCTHQAKPGQSVCGKHMTTMTFVVEQVCGYPMSNGMKHCQKACGDGMELCSRHHKMVVRRQETRRAREVWADVLDAMWTRRNVGEAFEILEDSMISGRLAERFVERWLDAFNDELVLYREHFLPALPPPPKSELQALAMDNQNVHTGAVNKQTSDGLQLLLETPVPAKQKTLKEIVALWDDKHHKSRTSVYNDMKNWYRVKFCREENDKLYRRALDGLWARIKASKDKDELVKRLWEECKESVGMCCDGHLSRLCNVMVGFDEEFKPPVSTGEMLQQKMAAIAEEDIDTLEKVEKAWKVMEELAVPMEERNAWIEAF